MVRCENYVPTMFNYCFVFVLLLVVSLEAKPTEVKCPEYCTCDIYETLRRATCQNKKLVSIEIGMPPEAQVLDLSNNQISALGANIFLEIGLTNLKLLNLSHNKVNEIHFQGFEGLNELKSLDLSYNNLRYFLEQWFVSLPSLRELYLRGNILRSLSTGPYLNFPQLRILDISSCAIDSLPPHIFHKLPSLRTLDISGNYLTHLKVDVIRDLRHLQMLTVHGNTFRCQDKNFVHLSNFIKTTSIFYDDPCKKVGRKMGHGHQFERMIADPSLTTPLKPNGWLYDPQEEKKVEVKLIEKCPKHVYDLDSATFHDRYIMEVISLSPILYTVFTIVFGVTLGIILGCSCQLRPKKYKVEYETLEDNLPAVPPRPTPRPADAQSIRSSIIRPLANSSLNFGHRPRTKSVISRQYPTDLNSLLMNESSFSDSTPVLTRKTP